MSDEIDIKKHITEHEVVKWTDSVGFIPREIIREGLQEPTGFENRTDSELNLLAFNFKISGTQFKIYNKGTETIKTTDTLALSGIEGLHYIYYDASANLTEAYNLSDTQYSEIIKNNPMVSTIYWDNVGTSGIYVGDERHGAVMDGATHAYLHFKNGLNYVNGLALDNINADGNGNIGSSAQFGVVGGEVADEDIYYSIGSVNSASGLPIYFRSGANGDWRLTEKDGYSVTNLVAGSRLYWNQLSGGTWNLTEANTGSFINCHIFATTDKDDPMVSFIGQEEYVDIVTATEGAETEINTLLFGNLLSPEIRPIGTVIFETSDIYGNDVKARVVTTDDGDDYIDYRTVNISRSTAVSDHGTLAGLGDDDHLQYALTSAGRGFTQTLSGTSFYATGSYTADGDFQGANATFAGSLTADQTIYTTGSNLVGINNSSPTATIHAIGQSGADGETATISRSGADALIFVGGRGGHGGDTQPGQKGGDGIIILGEGGSSFTSVGPGGSGGQLTITTGRGGGASDGTGAPGGKVHITTGSGGTSTVSGGGFGGDVIIDTGGGGPTNSFPFAGGRGGNVIIDLGKGATGPTTGASGLVGINTYNPQGTLDVSGTIIGLTISGDNVTTGIDPGHDHSVINQNTGSILTNTGSIADNLILINANTGSITDNRDAIASISGTNYWTGNGTDIYNNNAGNVGIGTATPTTRLEVSGDTTLTGSLSVSENVNLAKHIGIGIVPDDTFVFNAMGQTPTLSLGAFHTTNYTSFYGLIEGAWNGVTNPFVIQQGQTNPVVITPKVNTPTAGVVLLENKVGIGLVNPTAKLHIVDGGTIAVAGGVADFHSDDKNVWGLRIFEDAYSSSIPTFGFLGDNTGNGLLYNQGKFTMSLDNGKVGIGITTPTQMLHVSGTAAGMEVDAGTINTLFVSGGKVGINTVPAVSAALDISGTTGALIVPRMTTVDKNALTPINGMIIYETTVLQMQCYENGAWRQI